MSELLRIIAKILYKSYYSIFSNDVAVSMFDLGTMNNMSASDRNMKLGNLLRGFPGKDLGNHFLIICKHSIVEDMMNIAKSNKMFNFDSQWVFMVTDTNSSSFDMSPYIKMASDGYNLGFVFNTSIALPGIVCPTGIECVIKSTIDNMIQSFQNILENEFKIFDIVTIEEWDIIKPSPEERSMAIVEDIKLRIKETKGQCNNCTKWMMEAVEVREANRINQLEVGTWNPTLGLRYLIRRIVIE